VVNTQHVSLRERILATEGGALSLSKGSQLSSARCFVAVKRSSHRPDVLREQDIQKGVKKQSLNGQLISELTSARFTGMLRSNLIFTQNVPKALP
jgi:hypothetical protein